MSQLRLTLKNKDGKTIHKAEISDESYTIGRSENCSFVINDPKLSPTELIIKKKQEAYWIYAHSDSSGFVAFNQLYKQMIVDKTLEIIFHSYEIELYDMRKNIDQPVSESSQKNNFYFGQKEDTDIIPDESTKIVDESTKIPDESTKIIEPQENTKVVDVNTSNPLNDSLDESTRIVLTEGEESRLRSVESKRTNQKKWMSELKESVKNSELAGFLNKVELPTPTTEDLPEPIAPAASWIKTIKREYLVGGALVISAICLLTIGKMRSTDQSQVPITTNVEPLPTSPAEIQPAVSAVIPETEKQSTKNYDTCSPQEYLSSMSQLFETP